MKIELKDTDQGKFDVGYDYIHNTESDEDDALFWIDTPYECVTLHMNKFDLSRLINAMSFLRDNLK